METINAGDTAWVLVSAALVMLMTPGVAFFYGGMVRSKSVLNMLMMSFTALAVVAVVWIFYGFSLAFGDDLGGGLLGGLDLVGLSNAYDQAAGFAGGAGAAPWPGPHAVPLLAFAMFQLMFAAITASLISGAVADRLRFWSWIVFLVLWTTLVYCPIAHWVFSSDGFVGPDAVGGWIVSQTKLGALDYAGGTAVHINAGAAALALAIVLGRRRGWPHEPMRPHGLPFTILGASLLWFGWFGFNAGSALTAGPLAATAFTNTMAASATATLGWLIVEQVRDGKPTSLGGASGAVAGLVAITPAAGFVTPIGGAAIGLVAGVMCPLALGLKFRLGFDDSLDVVGIHLVGGVAGTLLVGVFATTAVNPQGADGLLYGGGPAQLIKQAVAALAVLGYAFVVTAILALVVRSTLGLRVSAAAEVIGIDETEHAEAAYDFSALRGGAGLGTSRPTATSQHSAVGATAGRERWQQS